MLTLNIFLIQDNNIFADKEKKDSEQAHLKENEKQVRTEFTVSKLQEELRKNFQQAMIDTHTPFSLKKSIDSSQTYEKKSLVTLPRGDNIASVLTRSHDSSNNNKAQEQDLHEDFPYNFNGAILQYHTTESSKKCSGKNISPIIVEMHDKNAMICSKSQKSGDNNTQDSKNSQSNYEDFGNIFHFESEALGSKALEYGPKSISRELDGIFNSLSPKYGDKKDQNLVDIYHGFKDFQFPSSLRNNMTEKNVSATTSQDPMIQFSPQEFKDSTHQGHADIEFHNGFSQADAKQIDMNCQTDKKGDRLEKPTVGKQQQKSDVLDNLQITDINTGLQMIGTRIWQVHKAAKATFNLLKKSFFLLGAEHDRGNITTELKQVEVMPIKEITELYKVQNIPIEVIDFDPRLSTAPLTEKVTNKKTADQNSATPFADTPDMVNSSEHFAIGSIHRIVTSLLGEKKDRNMTKPLVKGSGISENKLQLIAKRELGSKVVDSGYMRPVQSNANGTTTSGLNSADELLIGGSTGGNEKGTKISKQLNTEFGVTDDANKLANKKKTRPKNMINDIFEGTVSVYEKRNGINELTIKYVNDDEELVPIILHESLSKFSANSAQPQKELEMKKAYFSKNYISTNITKILSEAEENFQPPILRDVKKPPNEKQASERGSEKCHEGRRRETETKQRSIFGTAKEEVCQVLQEDTEKFSQNAKEMPKEKTQKSTNIKCCTPDEEIKPEVPQIPGELIIKSRSISGMANEVICQIFQEEIKDLKTENKTVEINKDTLKDTASIEINSPSAAVVILTDGLVGPGASKNSAYKNPEYYSYHKHSFYEAEVELQKYRLPQPSAKKVETLHRPTI